MVVLQELNSGGSTPPEFTMAVLTLDRWRTTDIDLTYPVLSRIRNFDLTFRDRHESHCR